MRSWMIGFVTAVTGTAFLPALPPSALPAFIIAIFLVYVWRHGRFVLTASGLLLGFAVGTVAGNHLLERRLDPSCIGVPIELEGTVSSLPSTFTSLDGTPGRRFTFSLHSLSPQACRGPQDVHLSVYEPLEIAVGERWRFVTRLKPPRGYANPGSAVGTTIQVLQGLDATGHVMNVSQATLVETPVGIGVLHHRLRHSINQAIDALPLAQDVRGVLQALTVANKDGLNDTVWLAFRDLGLSHLLVISGLHVGMAAGLGYFLGKLFCTLLIRMPAATALIPSLLALLSAIAYSALAGFTLPTQRAVYMLGALLAAKLFARNIASLDRLLLAAVLVLLVNPLSVVGVGLWLSFGAVAGLLWITAWGRSRSGAVGLLRGHIYMSVVMLPLGALFFGGSSTVSALANLIAIPLMGFVIVPLSLLGVLLHVLGSAGAETAWLVAAWPLEYFLQGVEVTTQSLGARLFAPLSASHVAKGLALIGVYLMCIPGPGYARLWAMLLFVPLVLPVGDHGHVQNKSTIVTVMDAGQGTSVIIRSGKRALLYDTGGGSRDEWNFGSRVLVPYLQSLGFNSLESFIVSHRDSDHSAGTQAVLDSLRPQRFRFGDQVEYQDYAGLPCTAGESWAWPEGQMFTFLSPGRDDDLDSNNTSCVLQLQVNGYRFILAGDIERSQERELAAHWREELKTDWLLVPHHGSQTSSSSTFLKFTAPDVAVFSSGFANRFGHPHPDVYRRYVNLGAELLNTAEDGALEFRISPTGELSVVRYRNNYRPYWL